MDSLEQQTTTSRGIPGFDDEMVNIRELVRIMAESRVNETIDAQAEDACGEGDQRNGYRERGLVTGTGVIRLRIPELRRGGFFPEDLPVRYSRADGAATPPAPRSPTYSWMRPASSAATGAASRHKSKSTRSSKVAESKSRLR